MTRAPRLLPFVLAWCMAILPIQADAEIHGTITGTTDYVFRMYSKSAGKPAIQGNLDYQNALGFYTGFTVSSFDIGRSELDESLTFLDQANAEVVPYVGWTFKLNDDWRIDTQYSHYFYDGLVYGNQPDYDEFYLFVHYKDLISFQTSYASDFYGWIGDGYFHELTGRYPLTDFLEISGSYGYANTKSVLVADYHYWNTGITFRYKFMAFDVRYYEAAETNRGEELEFFDHPITLKQTVVFSISAGF